MELFLFHLKLMVMKVVETCFLQIDLRSSTFHVFHNFTELFTAIHCRRYHQMFFVFGILLIGWRTLWRANIRRSRTNNKNFNFFKHML